MTTAQAGCERAVQYLHEGVQARATVPGGKLLWRVQGLKGGARAYFMWRFLTQYPRPALVVLPSAKEAEVLVEDLRCFYGEDESAPPFARRIHYFPSWDIVPFEDLSPTGETVAARVEGLYHLQQTKDPIVVTTADALLLRVPPRAHFAERLRYLVEGDSVDLDSLASQLTDWGYRRVPLVEDRGDFSVRGGILDIFPPAHPQPLRIELIGDVIEAIREFDPVSQRSLGAHPEFLVLPVREFDAHGRSSRAALRAIEARALDLEVSRDERARLLDGSSIVPGDVLLGLPSHGLHTNGYTMALRLLPALEQRALDVLATLPWACGPWSARSRLREYCAHG